MMIEALLGIIAAGVWTLVIRSWWLERYLAAIDANLADLQDELRDARRERVLE